MRTDWLSNDDDTLLNAVERYGRNWKTISANHFPSRSRLDLSNRFVLTKIALNVIDLRRYTLLSRKRRNELLTVKQEPMSITFSEMYQSQSPEISGGEVPQRSHQVYGWSTSASPAQSLVMSSPSGHSSLHSHHMSISSSHASIEETPKSRWEDSVQSNNVGLNVHNAGPMNASGFVVDHSHHHHAHHQHPSRINSAPPMYHTPPQTTQAYVSVSSNQVWTDAKPVVMADSSMATPQSSYSMSPLMMAVQSSQQSMHSAVDGRIRSHHHSHQHNHSEDHNLSHLSHAHNHQHPLVNTPPASLAGSPDLLSCDNSRASSVAPTIGTPLSLPMQVDHHSSVSSAAAATMDMYNALNHHQGAQVTLVFP
jgi:hypothetical protein